uniref:Uncharacterized protein n=1 Tax=Anopheles quadriannulatus TaxID=34691 RepID=A0A1I8JVL5_ANOQN
MSSRKDFFRSIIESSSSIGGSNNDSANATSQNLDSGYRTGVTTSGEEPAAPLPVQGRGRAWALSSLGVTMAPPADAAAPLVTPMENLVMGGRGRFLQKLLSQAAPTAATVEPPADTTVPISSATSGAGTASIKDSDARSVASRQASDVTKAEDSFVLRECKEQGEPVIRIGKEGNPLHLMGNFMELKCEPDRGIFLYTVDFSPPIDAKRTRQRCIDSHKDVFGTAYTFDGHILLLPKALEQERFKLTSQHPTEGTPVTLSVVFRVQQQMSQNVAFYNKLFRRIMYMLQLSEMGRKHFDPTQARIIPQHKLEIWPGFVTAVNEFEGGLMLNLDVTHRVLMQTTVYTHIKMLAQARGGQFRENVLKSLLGAVVLTRYNKKTYRIDDVCFDTNPLSTFRYGERDISYVEYYKEQYGLEIKDHQQPLLLNRSERRVVGKTEPEEMIVCLVPEICFLTGLTDEMRNDHKVMRDIATYTRITPNQRLVAMRQFCENVNKNEAARKLLASWGLELMITPKVMMGRQLPPENITSGGGVVGSAGPNVDYTRQVTNNPMLEIVHIRQWMLLYTQRDEQHASVFRDCVKRTCKLLGLEVAQPQVEVLPQDATNLYVQALRTRIRPGTQIVVIICPTSRDDRYAAIKRILCTEVPIPSQVINARTFANEKRNRSVVLKVLLQMNCKLGGSLWGVRVPIKRTMICGIDTYHEAKQRSNSVAAFVGSLDAAFTHWYSRATVQERKEEILNGLCVSLEKTLQAYQRRNCHLPDRIIIFRDGVSDEQTNICQDYEIPQLQAACKLVQPDYEPKITFIVVQKRIITRLFTMSRGGGDGEGQANAPPGTVLDNTVTRRYMFDFFLVSQTVQMGTVTPTHYIVLRDDSKFSPDILQQLSYKMCYMYYNWTGTIRVPACCQYAHKLAYLVGQSVKRMPAESLNDKLFYL